MTQQFHSSTYTLRKPKLKETHAPQHSALFTVAGMWKQTRCSLTDEWIQKLWYIYTVEYYSVIKRNAFESVLMKWMNLEPVIQSEVSQKEKNRYFILTHIYGIQKNDTGEPICKAIIDTDIENRLWTWQGKEVGEIERIALKHIHYHV